jgi:hypothetical protein
MKNLKVGMKCSWLQVPRNRIKRGYTFFGSSTLTDVTVMGVYHDERFVKLRGRIAYGGYHTDWYSINDIFHLNREDIFENSIRV